MAVSPNGLEIIHTLTDLGKRIVPQRLFLYYSPQLNALSQDHDIKYNIESNRFFFATNFGYFQLFSI